MMLYVANDLSRITTMVYRAAFVAVMSAVAAYHCRQPVRLILPRNVDMAWSGGRNPFYAKYEVVFDDSGRVTGLDVCVYLNAGKQ